MKSSRFVLAVAVAAALAGCSHTDYVLGGRTFHSYEEARAYVRTTYDQWVAEVQPLPAPIAGPAIVIVPTRAQWEADARRDFPWMNDQEIKNAVELTVGDQYSFRVIERRNIFESARLVEAESADGTEVPPHGYLILHEMRQAGKHTGTDMHIIASGEAGWTKIFDGGQIVDPKEATPRLLQAIEDYVKAHPAAG